MTKHEYCELAKVEYNSLTDAQYNALETLYILLDVDKVQFAKVAKAIGVETIEAKRAYYAKALTGYDELEARERSEKRRSRIADLEREMEALRTQEEEYKRNAYTYGY